MTICYAGSQLKTAVNTGLTDNKKKKKFLKDKPTKLSDTVGHFAPARLVGPYTAYLDGLPPSLQDAVIRAGRSALQRGDHVQIDILFTQPGQGANSTVSSTVVGGGVLTTITLTVPPPP
jgi:hypothetical protein